MLIYVDNYPSTCLFPFRFQGGKMICLIIKLQQLIEVNGSTVKSENRRSLRSISLFATPSQRASPEVPGRNPRTKRPPVKATNHS